MSETTPAKATKAAVTNESKVVQASDDWRIQVSKKINGDLWNIRAKDAWEFLELIKGLAEMADPTLEFLGDWAQAVIAKGVQTDTSYGGGGGGGRAAAAAPAENSGPPRCKHGVMNDFADRGYRHRYYCPAKVGRCDPRD